MGEYKCGEFWHLTSQPARRKARARAAAAGGSTASLRPEAAVS